MDGLILLIKPGRVGVIDSRSATAALQFYGRRIGLDQRWENFYIQFHSNTDTDRWGRTWLGRRPFHDEQSKTANESDLMEEIFITDSILRPQPF